jgi:hypothetical protein
MIIFHSEKCKYCEFRQECYDLENQIAERDLCIPAKEFNENMRF